MLLHPLTEQGQHYVGKQLMKGTTLMPSTISRGDSLSLTQVITAAQLPLGKLMVRGGWYVGGSEACASAFRFDIVAAALNGTGRIPSYDWFVHYNVDSAPDRVLRLGIERERTLLLDPQRIPAHIERVVVAVNLYLGRSRNQTFGQASGLFIDVYDFESQKPLVHYDFSEPEPGSTLIVIGEFYREAGSWHFRAIGDGMDQSHFRNQYSVTYF